MAGETLLVISGDGVPPYSARGLTQSLELIDVAKPVRTVNGGLIDVSPPQFRKYLSVLSCTDFDPPAFAGLYSGSVVTVDCVAEIGFATATGSPPPGRTVVATRTEGAYSFVRLRLQMMVMGAWTLSRAEYSHEYQWQLPLEET